MSGSYYSDDEDLDIRVHRRRAPSPVHFVEPRPRARPFYPAGQTFLVPERTVVTTRSRSRERSRERRSSSPSVAPAPQPVIINNKIYNEHSSDEEDNRRVVIRGRRRSSGSRSRSGFRTREDYEIERTRRELEELRLIQAREREDRRNQKEYKDDADHRRTQLELDDIKRRQTRDDDEKRIKRELELQRLREEERVEEEKKKLKREMELERLREEEREEEERKRRDKEAKAAVEKYKSDELEKTVKTQREKEARDADYKRRLQEDLLNSGLDEKAIQAILKKEKLPEGNDGGRPTYTRMARRHLSIETLRTFRIEYDLDPDPEYILIKRWVPEWEQDTLWKHTKYLREKRSKTILAIEDGHHKKHHHHEPELEWVRKKERRRSKSPALLMYLAGARPS